MDHVRIPVRIVGKQKWAMLTACGGPNHIIVGEKFACKDQQYSFADGHRVRLYSVKQNVHWKIPEGIDLDVSGVTPAGDPPRRKVR